MTRHVCQSMGERVDLVRRFYESFGKKDRQTYLQMCDEDIEWTVMDGMPEGGRYLGKKSVFDGYFPRMLSHFAEFHAVAEEFLEASEKVIVLGRYKGVAKNTGRDFESPFAHVYTVSGSRITNFRQYADTKSIWDSLAPT